MKLIVGLGNPGEKYEHNRHNIGFVVADEFSKKLQESQSSDRSPRIAQGSELGFKISKKFNAEIIQTADYILAKPTTFMNESGRAVVAISHFYKIHRRNIYIIHDDLDMPIGKYKITFGHGPKVHNGLGSIREQLATKDFWYVKIGVENRVVRGNSETPGVEYSLQNFAPDEQKIMSDVIKSVVGELEKLII